MPYRRLRAPSENGATLVEPPWEQLDDLIAENAARRGSVGRYDVQGCTLAALSRRAREELLAAARRWTGSYRDLPTPPPSDGLVFLAGHQPQLFHPGVWYKNAVLDHLARQHGAVAVNLLIDSDQVRTTSIRVPDGSRAEPAIATLALDRPEPHVPYEERAIVDAQQFCRFGESVLRTVSPWIPDALVADFWPLACRRASATGNLGAALAQARHGWEARWSMATLEVPQSHLCEGQAFRWFVAHLLAHLPQFHSIYNESVREYRRLHRIRNAAHPVPELKASEGWLEAPFWVWRSSEPHRRGLWARQRDRSIEISDRGALRADLPLSPTVDAGVAVEQLTSLAGAGWKLRSRALTTTLFARLFLGDVFIHGIGGAKYDQLADVIGERFFAFRLPGHLVVSATLLLPVPRLDVSVDDLRRIDRQLRELTFQPERHARAERGEESRLAQRVAEKARWIATPPTRETARTRFRAIRRTNAELQPFVAETRQSLLRERDEVLKRLRDNAVLSWREYPFCVYPEATLRQFLFDSLPQRAAVS